MRLGKCKNYRDHIWLSNNGTFFCPVCEISVEKKDVPEKFADHQRKPHKLPSSRISSWQKVRLRKALLERDGKCCHYCEVELNLYMVGLPNSITIDHKIPVVKGGTHDLDNLVLACLWCNSRKSDIDYFDFIEMLREEDDYEKSERIWNARKRSIFSDSQ